MQVRYIRMENRPSESFIKAMLLNDLLKNDNSQDTFAITEFSIANFSRRVDIVLSKNKNLYAFEIKSEFDSLIRLEGQIVEYLKHFDKVTVVSTSKHINNILLKTPKNVSVWELADSKIRIVRRGKKNKIKTKSTFIKMMTLTELLRLAQKNKISLVSNKRKDIEKSLSTLSISLIREEALINIKDRYKKRNNNYYDYAKLPILSITKEKPESKDKVQQCNKIEKYIHALDNFIDKFK